MRLASLSALLILLAALPAAVLACSSDEDSSGSGGSESEIKKYAGDEGAACNDSKKCKTGLLCKAKSSGPPPGAVGLPLPPGSSSGSGGPPPGAVGLPLPPADGVCSKPADGDEGSTCTEHDPCNSGLVCDFSRPQNSSSSGGPPPGAVGLPMPRQGTCAASSGPPPGAVGLPIQQK